MTEVTSPVLRVEGLHRWLGNGENRQHVLRGLNFSLDAGKVYAVVGPSGCGKSTLLYLLGLLDKPDEGSIFIEDQRLDAASDEERRSEERALRHAGVVLVYLG